MSESLADLIGQSLMVRFAGPEPTPELIETLARTRPCGVVLFADNVRTPAGVHALIGAIQAEAARLGLPPLLVAVDQEGGVVSRLPAPFVTVPSQMAQAAIGDPDVAYRCARLTGRQLAAVGINTNFAPVLDANSRPANPVIGTRSFGQHPALVAQLGLAALRGYRETAIIATAKHFPGHGSTTVDSHLGLPVVHDDRQRLVARDLAPFVAAIEAGVPAMMTAHVVFTALDECPATLSRAILTDLLRRDLGYEGVVFADSLQMRAIADRYPSTEAARLAKAAGADVLLPLGTLAEQRLVAQSLCDAAESGELSPALFEATARRLDRLRADHRLTYQIPPCAEPAPAIAAAALTIAHRSIAVVRGRAALPLAANTRLALVDCLLPRWSLISDAVERAELLSRLVLAAFPRASAVAIEPEPTDGALAGALALARSSEVVLLVTRNAFLIERQVQLARAVVELGLPVVHAAVHSPYDAAVIPGAAATLLTYGDPPVSLEALVDVLAGHARSEGVLPVRLPASRAVAILRDA